MAGSPAPPSPIIPDQRQPFRSDSPPHQTLQAEVQEQGAGAGQGAGRSEEQARCRPQVEESGRAPEAGARREEEAQGDEGQERQADAQHDGTGCQGQPKADGCAGGGSTDFAAAAADLGHQLAHVG